MESKNLKSAKIAQKLAGLFKKDLIPQEIYSQLRNVWRKNKDYFQTLTPEDFIRIIFFIYSLNHTGNYDLGIKMINDLIFSFSFHSDLEDHSEECSSCDGSGTEECGDCDGSGNQSCRECDGEGELTCDVCDGSGKEECSECGGSGKLEDGEICDDCGGTGDVKCDSCDGSGEMTCNECDGEGTEDCSTCRGYGKNECEECYGDGNVEDGTQDYTIRFFCTWNKDLKDFIEINQRTENGMDEVRYDEFSDQIIDFISHDGNDNLKNFIDSSEVYFFDFEDNPELTIDWTSQISRKSPLPKNLNIFFN